ncbi:hypothetical protein PE067_03330 [Paracoccus sp. DMF-8]|uniref:hypothetical protein n=1 Tax=Paracoccus sp. DMF-8 TaxID=3019445 RepID=UPI0023E81522|nr:hypothetical protein [Paracoccus sp. DMF-8]MDF3605273.1 hypothetical protein [Paracoccus sp. DMF-8]
MDGATAQAELHIIQRHHAGEFLADAADFQQRIAALRLVTVDGFQGGIGNHPSSLLV